MKDQRLQIKVLLCFSPIW